MTAHVMISPAKRLLILGAGRYNVPSLVAASRAGFVTFVADRNPSAPGLAVADVALAVDLADIESLRREVEARGGVDGVVSMAEAGVRPSARLAAQWGLPGITEQAAENATSKAAMRRAWSGLGSWNPNFRVVGTQKQAIHAAMELGTFPLILKPDRSLGGSRGVSRVNKADEVPAAYQFAVETGLPNTEVVVEQCVEGTEYSAEVLVWEGNTSLLCIGQKIKSSPPFRVDLSVRYPAPLSPQDELKIHSMCDSAVRALGITQGAGHLEFAVTEDGPMLFEIGARCGGGHSPQIAAHVSGVDEFIESCRMACGLPPINLHPRRSRGAEYRFLIFPSVIPRAFSIPTCVREHPAILDVEITAKSGVLLASPRTTSDRPGFLVSIGDNLPDAVNKANSASSQIVMIDEAGIQHRALVPGGETNSVLDVQDRHAVVRRYQERIAQHGPTLDSLATGGAQKQDMRHSVHASSLRSSKPSVLDIGCGLGDFIAYLRRQGIECDYSGYDIVPEYIEECRRRFPHDRFSVRDIFEEGIEGTYDTIVMSQVLNNRYQRSDNMLVMTSAIELALRHAHQSVSVDMLSIHVDYQNPDIFYYDPAAIFTWAKSVCGRVVLRHDYRKHEFCLQLFQPGASGYVP